jgi:hypothetical protein
MSTISFANLTRQCSFEIPLVHKWRFETLISVQSQRKQHDLFLDLGLDFDPSSRSTQQQHALVRSTYLSVPREFQLSSSRATCPTCGTRSTDRTLGSVSPHFNNALHFLDLCLVQIEMALFIYFSFLRFLVHHFFYLGKHRCKYD